MLQKQKQKEKELADFNYENDRKKTKNNLFSIDTTSSGNLTSLAKSPRRETRSPFQKVPNLDFSQV